MLHDRFRLTGTTIAHKYAVLEVVEEGGFSVVYRARHLVWGRLVALKAFKATEYLSDEQREKLVRGFVREGAILSELSERSTAICQSRDIGTLTLESGEWVPYLVLEWLDGDSLEVQIRRERDRGMPPRTLAGAMRLLAPIAGALALAHRRGISHRDVKPGNMVVLRDGGMKLLDFGIAQEAGATHAAPPRRQTRMELRSFTPQYGAPEQFSMAFGTSGAWTDVFALALILVELVAGREPLNGASLDDLAAAALDPRRRPTPRSMGLDPPAEVEAVFARALAVDPAARFATVGDFWHALERAAALEGASRPDRVESSLERATLRATAASVPPVASAAPRRAPGLTAGASAAVVATLVVATVLARRSAVAPAAEPVSPVAPVELAAAAPTRTTPDAPAARPSCPEGMALVPGGRFSMGSDEDTPAERPAHPVTLSPYCMDLTEVTTAAFKRCSDRGDCKRASPTNDWGSISAHERRQLDGFCNVRDAVARGEHPINCVDWEMATLFCAARGARLPTEAEWELAARGLDGRTYPWGDAEPNGHLLNACGKECVAFGAKSHIDASPMYGIDDGWVATAPVASFPLGQSSFGMHDMVGNVWEWVSDKYGQYPHGPERDPVGADAGAERVIRGGAWNAGHPSWVRSSFRNKAAPTTRSHAIGFRCARWPGPATAP